MGIRAIVKMFLFCRNVQNFKSLIILGQVDNKVFESGLNQGSLGAAEEKNVSGLQWSQKCQWKSFHGFECISMGNRSCLVLQVTWQVKLYSVTGYVHVSQFVPHSSIHATVHIVLQLDLSMIIKLLSNLTTDLLTIQCTHTPWFVKDCAHLNCKVSICAPA